MTDRSDLTLKVTSKGALAGIAHLAECPECRTKNGLNKTLRSIAKLARAGLNQEPLP